MALHAAWNLSALSGLSGFLGLYLVVQVPIFAVFVGVAVAARRREGALSPGTSTSTRAPGG